MTGTGKVERKLMSLEALRLVAARFKVLSDPTRLQILQLLQSGEESVSEIAQAVQTTQPNVSKHLRILQDAGLLSRRQDRNTVYYTIADQSVFELCDSVCSSLAERFSDHANTLLRSHRHRPRTTTRRS
jgi:ArsR family transcriptional regulator